MAGGFSLNSVQMRHISLRHTADFGNKWRAGVEVPSIAALLCVDNIALLAATSAPVIRLVLAFEAVVRYPGMLYALNLRVDSHSEAALATAA